MLTAVVGCVELLHELFSWAGLGKHQQLLRKQSNPQAGGLHVERGLLPQVTVEGRFLVALTTVNHQLRLLLLLSQQEASEVPLTLPSEGLTNGDLMEAEEDEAAEDPAGAALGPPIASAISSDVDGEMLEAETVAAQGQAAALIAAARAMVSEEHLKQRLAARGHPCSQCDRVFMSMQGLRSHERSHSAMALFSKEDKYSCQYCQFVSPFRHK